MRTFILNKRYDTEDATAIGTYAVGQGEARIVEVLYRKITGEYFLHGRGGELTRYAVSMKDGTFQQGEAVTPLSYAAANIWAKNNLGVLEYNREFDPYLGNPHIKKKVVSLKLDEALDARVRLKSSELEIRQAEIYHRALKFYLDYLDNK